MPSTRFEKATMERIFFFIGFSIETIEGKEFIKINILDKGSNTAFSIYKENNGDLYNEIVQLEEFENVDSKIFVVYKNGRLKFDFRSN